METSKNDLIVIVGLGSIGRRHLRNLKALGQGNFLLYRTRQSTLPDDELAGLPVTYDLDEALSQRPTAVVVANPTAMHLPAALAAAKAGSHLFLEKPISHNLDGVETLRQEVDARQLAVLVGFQFRFHPGLMKIKHLLEADTIGPVVGVRAHWGEYLPNWHPWEDYRQSYSARPDLGGGVILTLCHPFDYLRWLVGEVAEVSALTGYNGGLDIPVEDTASVNLQFASGAVGHVYLDYVQRPPSHWLHITGQRGLIRWDNADGAVHCYRADTEQWEVFPVADDFERNTMFLDAARNFLACLRGEEQSRCDLNDGIQALRIGLAAKQAALEKKVIQL